MQIRKHCTLLLNFGEVLILADICQERAYSRSAQNIRRYAATPGRNISIHRWASPQAMADGLNSHDLISLLQQPSENGAGVELFLSAQEALAGVGP